MSNNGLPPPLPPGRRPSPVAAPVPVAATLPQQVAPAPLPAQPKNSLPTASAPAGTGKYWWAWFLAGAFACFLLFLVCLNCNPATTLADRTISKLQGAIAQQLDPQLHPLLSWGMNLLFSNYIALPYAQVQTIGLAFAFFACLFIPASSSLLSAALGHPIFLIGGAPGGWRSTWQNYGLHRFICDFATLLVIALALFAPMEPITAASILIVFLPAIRVGSMITLWVLLARSHGFGVLRIIFLGLPNIFFVSLFSSFVAFVLGLYFYAYLVARSF